MTLFFPVFLLIVYTCSLIGRFGVSAVIVLILGTVVALWRYQWKKTAIVLALAGAPFILIGGALVIQPWIYYAHSFRLTLEVETPEGIKSGSSVIEVKYIPNLLHWNSSAPGISAKVRGEAIFLELGQGKNVIATLAFGPTGSDVSAIDSLAAQALGHELPGFYKRAPSWTGRAELTGKLIPTLVTFTDPADPMTLSVVPPDQFERVFGPGYRFKGMWLEMTKDKATDNDIEEKLPWLIKMMSGLDRPHSERQRVINYRMNLLKYYDGVLEINDKIFVRD